MKAFVQNADGEWAPLPDITYYHCTYGTTHWIAPAVTGDRESFALAYREDRVEVLAPELHNFEPNAFRFEQSGKEPLRLMPLHGRDTADEVLDDWGFGGEAISNIKSLVTSAEKLVLSFTDNTARELPIELDLLVVDGKWYGRWEVQYASSFTEVAHG